MCYDDDDEYVSSATGNLYLLRIYFKNAMDDAQKKLKIEVNSIAGSSLDKSKNVESLIETRNTIKRYLKELKDTSEDNLVGLCNRYIALDYDLTTGRGLILKSHLTQLSKINNVTNSLSQSNKRLSLQAIGALVISSQVTQEGEPIVYVKSDTIRDMREDMKRLKSEINNHYAIDESLRELTRIQIAKTISRRTAIRILLHDILLANHSDVQSIAQRYYGLINS